MNVLAPVTDGGRLYPTLRGDRFRGFSVGEEFTVADPDSRKRAIHARVGGGTCPWMSLEEVLSRDAARLKQAVARARIVVVHSLEIDNAGEKGAGPAFFDHAIQRLRAAWRLLRDAGVHRFVITSDYGFHCSTEPLALFKAMDERSTRNGAMSFLPAPPTIEGR
jgi:hypothetical protein